MKKRKYRNGFLPIDARPSSEDSSPERMREVKMSYSNYIARVVLNIIIVIISAAFGVAIFVELIKTISNGE